MPNALDITADTANIMVVGDSGTGKTYFLGTIPGIEIIDFDWGMASLRGRDIQYRSFRDLPKGITPTKKQTEMGLYEWGTGWMAFFNYLNNDLGKRIDKGEGPQALALDSLSFMGELAMNAVLKGYSITVPDQRSYGAQQVYLKTVLSQLATWPIRIIATAHIKRDENLVTGVTEKLPMLIGQLAGFISAFFDEVYFADRKVKADGKVEYFVQTKPTPVVRQAKSRWGVPDGTALDFAELSKFYGAPVPAVPSAGPGDSLRPPSSK
jgi:hypothetical protein